MDILASGVRAVVIPYETAGETEQRLRAEILAERGLMTVVPATELSPKRLAQGIARALAAPRPQLGAIDLAGARRTAAILHELAASGTKS